MKALSANKSVALSCTLGMLLAAAPSRAADFDPVADRANAIECLATAIGYEAGYEPLSGQQAVAEVILNRVRSPGFPKTVCDVVYSGSTRRTGCQFTFTCDGSMLRRRLPATLMESMRSIAEAALTGAAPAHVRGATHYHANYVLPYWASSLVRIGQIGAHIFYRQLNGADPAAMPGYVGGSPPLTLTAAGEADPSRNVAAKVLAKPAAPAIFAPWGLLPSGR